MLNLIHIDDIINGIELAMQLVGDQAHGKFHELANLASPAEPVSIKALADLVIDVSSCFFVFYF